MNHLNYNHRCHHQIKQEETFSFQRHYHICSDMVLKKKLSIDDQGYVKISDVLSHQRLKSLKTTRDDINRIVQENDKKRFTIKDDMICANQGHSLKAVKMIT